MGDLKLILVDTNPEVCRACQMALAYRSFLAPPASITWDYASNRQPAIKLGGDFQLS